jgi:hypothetical protein
MPMESIDSHVSLDSQLSMEHGIEITSQLRYR